MRIVISTRPVYSDLPIAGYGERKTDRRIIKANMAAVDRTTAYLLPSMRIRQS